ncbi:MAG: hypothetical protein ACD_84C00018G0004 [uncultured bacterium]|nr:MAG: hypothetical protein ACD_84C00018G0004 [uncultured bacterium]
MLPHDKLLELLNNDNPRQIKFDRTNVTFSNPIENIGEGYNTRINVDSVPGGGFLGNVDVFYHRINLADLGNDIWLFSDMPFTEDMIISMLNTSRNAFLLASDLDAMAVPIMAVGDIRSIVFTTQPNSVNWIGSNNAMLIIGFPGIVSRLDLFLNTTLPSTL